MTKKKKRDGRQSDLALLVILLLFAFLLANSDAPGGAITLRAWAVLLGSLLVIFIRYIVFPLFTWWRIRHVIELEVALHRLALTSMRTQKLRPDPYGTIERAEWDKEVLRFLKSRIVPRLSRRQKRALYARLEKWVRFIDRILPSDRASGHFVEGYHSDMDAREFELYCSAKIQDAGWTAHVTPKGRDQGADIIAEKNEARLVVQCKKYSRPVGNAAVQEVVAAMNHYHARHACVVTDSSYTSAALQLAKTNCVALLHFSDLEKIDEHLAIIEARAKARGASRSGDGNER